MKRNMGQSCKSIGIIIIGRDKMIIFSFKRKGVILKVFLCNSYIKKNYFLDII